MSNMHEFRPRVRGKRARIALAVVLSCLTLAGAAVLILVAAGSHRISYKLSEGRFEVDSGSLLDGWRAFASADVESAEGVVLRGGGRARGTAVPGMCSGIYRYDELGSVWQATNCSRRAVVLRVRGEARPIVVTPPDPDALLRALKTNADYAVTLPRASGFWLRALPATLALGLVVMTAMLFMLFVTGPERMLYRIANGELVLKTLFSRRAYPLQELSVRRHSPTRVWRIAGSALPGYYTGLYRADGVNTRLYATELGSGVLIEGPKRLFLTPADPDAFVSAMREAGARG